LRGGGEEGVVAAAIGVTRLDGLVMLPQRGFEGARQREARLKAE
jgi:hypothetical protein